MKQFALVTLSLLWSMAFADDIQRCEAPNGEVTYSNEKCPSGTKPVRKVDTRPAIVDMSSMSRAQREEKAAQDQEALEEAESESLARARDQAQIREDRLDKECNQLRVMVNKAKEIMDNAEAGDREALQTNLFEAQATFERRCPGRSYE